MATWIKDSSGNLVNLDNYNQVRLTRWVDKSGSTVSAENDDMKAILILGSNESCKEYYDSLLEHLGFNIWSDNKFPEKRNR